MLNSGGLLIAPLNGYPESNAGGSTKVVLPLAVFVGSAHGRSSLPLSIQLHRYGRLTLPIHITVPQSGKLTLPIALQVLPPEALAETQAWSLRLLIGGIDFSAHLIGQCRVEMEEGTQRVMQCQLEGPQDIASLSGQSVVLDLLKTGGSIRLFSGSVELPELAISQQVITLSCVDNRRKLLANADRATLAEWLGGYWSPAVFSSEANSLQYAEDRLSTVAASFDLDVYGQPRLTNWQSAVTPHFTVDESLIWGDVEPVIEFSRRAEMKNSVTAAFQYRYQRLRTYRHEVSWDMGISLRDFLVYEKRIAGTQYALQPKWLTPTRELFTSAVDSTSWHLSAAFWRSQPPSQIISVPIDWTVWDYSLAWVNHYTAADDPNCWGARLVLNHKVAQTVTETWAISVEATDSINKFGKLEGEVSGGNLEAAFDSSTWESDFSDTTSIPISYTDWSEGGIRVQMNSQGLPASLIDQTEITDATRQDANLAIQTIAAIAKASMLSTHRQTHVTWKTACMPFVDVDQTGQLDIRHLQGKGKVSRLVHLFDIETGEASTETRISLFADIAVGTIEEEALAAPEVPVVTVVQKATAATIATAAEPESSVTNQQKELIEHIWRSKGGVVISLKVKEIPILDDQPRYTNTVAVNTPAIDAADTDPLDLSFSYEHLVAIPFDPVTFN
ncbi:hypothetical protein LIN78_12165 [Leeia sp. TBRC 13508]|uniref:Tip attachment protein J domain-containing protein n=1 Tax=Leeia speluncae TaxID=2884804 RepID=A0ABS8D7Y0_9NEIS|nr:hypothetical protein [Leeia speluncae]MCB6184300.1 hypothetical protein [Leeia speluncae]